MSRRRSLIWVVAAVVVGLVMRGLATLAEPDRVGNMVLDVVNWAALWVVVPVLAGRGARNAVHASAIGLATAALEVLAYYGGAVVEAPFKVIWLIGGALAGALLAMLSQATRNRPWSSFLVPALFVLEPVAVLGAFRLAQRNPWSSWGASAWAEMCLGAGLAAVVALTAVLKSGRTDPAATAPRREPPPRVGRPA